MHQTPAVKRAHSSVVISGRLRSARTPAPGRLLVAGISILITACGGGRNDLINPESGAGLKGVCVGGHTLLMADSSGMYSKECNGPAGCREVTSTSANGGDVFCDER